MKPSLLSGAQAGADTPHARVAAWVASNSSKVLAYYPAEDATGSGTMGDESGNGRDGSYDSSTGNRTVDGETVADCTSTSGTAPPGSVAYASWMDDQRGCFAVVEFDKGTDFQNIVPRDRFLSGGGGLRSYQFRRIPTSGVLQFEKITGGVSSVTGTTALSTSTRYTVGWWWDGTTLRIYVNGSVDNSTTMSSPIGTSCPLYFGGSYDDSANRNMDGALGSVVILNSSMDSNSIPDLHDAWIGA